MTQPALVRQRARRAPLRRDALHEFVRDDAGENDRADDGELEVRGDVAEC